MGRTLFTPEQQEILRQNVYVRRVTVVGLSFTKEFKAIFLSEYNKGIPPREIMQNHGFDADMLGESKIRSISRRICEEYSKYGEFRELPMPSRKAPKADPFDADETKKLQEDIRYLKQEIKSLKKLLNSVK